MKHLTLEQQRARISNIDSAAASNKSYSVRHRVQDYLFGQAIYNLGDYPVRFSIAPTEYDVDMITDMAANGVKLIQIHEEWNDAIRVLGADKFSCFDPDGMRKFIDLCHYVGIKIIPYVSSGYLQEDDLDMRPEFTVTDRVCCNGLYFRYRRCSAGSPEWRNYILSKTEEILDEYGFDGIYNDLGTDSNFTGHPIKLSDGKEYDPEIEDLLGTIYHEVKRRGGIYKLHCDCGYNRPPCIDRVYDYLWVGESKSELKLGMGSDYDDYVVPCQDKRVLRSDNPDYYYAMTIPYLQFPLLTTRGRPQYGRRIDADVHYYNIDRNGPTNSYLRCIEIKKYMKEHPKGPYVYTHWSPIPDDPAEYERWCFYRQLYEPMVEDGSVVYSEIKESSEIISDIHENICVSMFVNEKTYLVISNFTGKPYKVLLSNPYRCRISGNECKEFAVPDGKILFLEKIQ